jgi:hypothetical protein
LIGQRERDGRNADRSVELRLFLMPALPDAKVVQFAKTFLDEHLGRFTKDIAICLKADAKKRHAYFPALITCIAFLDFLSGLYAGSLEIHSLKELKHYVRKFMDPSEYTEDRLNVLYELFRHKVAHLALPYAAFDTNTKPKTFGGQPRRLITWTVRASGPRPPINIVSEKRQISKAVTPWSVSYDHRAVISIRSFASDIIKSVPKYLRHLEKDKTARNHFNDCMNTYFPV